MLRLREAIGSRRASSPFRPRDESSPFQTPHAVKDSAFLDDLTAYITEGETEHEDASSRSTTPTMYDEVPTSPTQAPQATAWSSGRQVRGALFQAEDGTTKQAAAKEEHARRASQAELDATAARRATDEYTVAKAAAAKAAAARAAAARAAEARAAEARAAAEAERVAAEAEAEAEAAAARAAQAKAIAAEDARAVAVAMAVTPPRRGGASSDPAPNAPLAPPSRKAAAAAAFAHGAAAAAAAPAAAAPLSRRGSLSARPRKAGVVLLARSASHHSRSAAGLPSIVEEHVAPESPCGPEPEPLTLTPSRGVRTTGQRRVSVLESSPPLSASPPLTSPSPSPMNASPPQAILSLTPPSPALPPPPQQRPPPPPPPPPRASASKTPPPPDIGAVRQMQQMQMDLVAARRELDAVRERENRVASENQRLYHQNEVLLALTGRPNSGLADEAATLLGQVHRRHAAQLGLRRSRLAARTLQAAARGMAARSNGRCVLAAAVALQAGARRHLCVGRYRRCASSTLVVQTHARALLARLSLYDARDGACSIQAALRRRLVRRSYLASRRAARTLQRAVRRFLCSLGAGPGRAALRLQAQSLQRRVTELHALLAASRGGAGAEGARSAGAAGGAEIGAEIAAVAAIAASCASELEEQRGEVTALRSERARLQAQLEERDRAAAEAAAQHAQITQKLEGGFEHMIRANAVFEVPDFLAVDKLVCESHVFAAAGFEWKLWVKPFSGADDGHVGLYLTPASDLDEAYTADYSLAIVGRQGHILERELTGGRAKLQGCRAGHGWPTFVSRAEIASRRPSDPASMLLHDDGRLIITCSGLTNVRLREPSADLARTI